MDDLETLAARRVGTTVAGKWAIERVLGIGGMAAVFLARAADGSHVALKLLHADIGPIEELKKRFVREGSIGNALGGEGGTDGFVRVLEAGVAEDGTAYLAMEALDGETLYDRITRVASLPPAEVLELAERVLDVLVVAHARGIVHRDLKPENIQLTSTGRVKVLDFGIARVLDELRPQAAGEQQVHGIRGIPDKTATKTGMIIGTAAYMAPEQATGLVREVDARTDLFALGATMFRLLAGRTVHGPLGGSQEVIAAATEPAAPLAQVVPGLAPDVCSVVDRALAFLKPHRYPDAETMRADVRALRGGRRPPYALAVAEGKIAAGSVVATNAGPPPSAAPRTLVYGTAGTAGTGWAAPAPPPEASGSPPSAAAPPGNWGHPGPPRQGPAPTLVDQPPPSRVARTAPDPAPSATRPDRGRVPIVWIVAALALVAGVGVGVGVTTCRASDDPAPPAVLRPAPARDAGAAPIKR